MYTAKRKRIVWCRLASENVMQNQVLWENVKLPVTSFCRNFHNVSSITEKIPNASYHCDYLIQASEHNSGKVIDVILRAIIASFDRMLHVSFELFLKYPFVSDGRQ